MKCPYCDFNAYIPGIVNHNNWKQAYINAINAQSYFLKNKTIKSVFFGGGTPSLMEPSVIHDILNHIKKINNNSPIDEITLEANPSTVEYSKFQDFKNAGINRLSLGVQSFNDHFLKKLGRNHNKKEAFCALDIANNIFSDVSFDLMMGLPKQSFDLWKEEIETAKSFIKNHISIYQLTIEEGTKFYKDKVPAAKDDIASEMYLYNIEELEKIGIYQYEISNFAQKNHESIHNLNYWLGGEYLGIGPQAHGRILHNNNWYATSEIKLPMKWQKTALNLPNLLIDNPINDNILFQNIEKLTIKQRQEEQLITYLRLNKPIPDNILEIADLKKLNILINEKLIKKTNGFYVLSSKARLCLNHIVYYLLT